MNIAHYPWIYVLQSNDGAIKHTCSAYTLSSGFPPPVQQHSSCWRRAAIHDVHGSDGAELNKELFALTWEGAPKNYQSHLPNMENHMTCACVPLCATSCSIAVSECSTEARLLLTSCTVGRSRLYLPNFYEPCDSSSQVKVRSEVEEALGLHTR